MAEDRKLNGSVDLLAQAMRKVFDETVAPSLPKADPSEEHLSASEMPEGVSDARC